MLDVQNKTLEEWLGADEAARVDAILRDTAETLRQGILARISRRRQEFDQRSPVGSPERGDAERRAASRPTPVADPDTAFEEVNCPSCGLPTRVLGEEWSREVIDTVVEVDEDGLGGYYDVVTVTYGSESLGCAECELVLEGHDEILIADLPETFVLEMTEEPDYEPEFGND